MVGVDSAFVGMTDGGVGFPRARVMTDGGGGFPRARVMTECFFRVLGYGSMNSRVRGNDGCPAFAGMTGWGWIPLSWE